VPTIKTVISELDSYYALIQLEEVKRASIRPQGFRDESKYDKKLKEIDDAIKGHRKDIEDLLESYDQEPQRFVKYADKLPDFYKKGGAYETSVFIMTKFPAKDDAGDAAKKLQAAIDAVRVGIENLGFQARIAYEKDFEDWIWANVELFMFGCARGVAVLEARYASELNPNVAMEWGWMKGMGKPVLFLMEKSFPEKFKRADWSGLDPKTFNWDAPVNDINEHLKKFLT